ncbi:MAG: TIGR00282 family metallophosphoesterase [Erysipelotrichaceae bacterium]|nr:TIGR00282 family metallophosphoesterase [Erysipelotrichaceae bacterium]
MKILFLGDIVGKKGREVIRDFLPLIKRDYNPDFTIMNAENAAHGKGLTIKIYNELLNYGADALTMGNHTFSKKEILLHLDEMDKLICPVNHIDGMGEGYRIFKVNDKKLCVINVLGRLTQEEYTTDPYEALDAIFEDTKDLNIDMYFIDLHAEATAEKRVLAEVYKDKCIAVLGTHTHIQTADEQILDGCAFMSDVGMCGPFNSVIGRDIDECIRKMVYKEKTRFTVAETDPVLCGALIEIDDETNRAINIERIQIRPKDKRI